MMSYTSPRTLLRKSASAKGMISSMISFNKVVKFWFTCCTYFDSLRVHVVFTILGLFDAIIFSTMELRIAVGNLEVWHGYVFVLAHLFIPLFGLLNIISFVRRKPLSASDRDLLRNRVKFGGAQKLLLVTAIFQSSCFVTVFCLAAYNCKAIMDPSIDPEQVFFLLDHVAWSIFYYYLHCCVSNFSISVCLVGRSLTKMRHTLDSFRAAEMPESLVRRTIGDYDHLIEVSDRLCQFRGLPNLFILAHSVMSVVFDAHYLIRSAVFDVSMWDVDKYSLTIVQLAYIIFALGAGFILFATCTINQSEAEKFNEALASLCIRDKTGTLVRNPYVAAHFAIGKKLKFSACGCFNIDYRLGYSMLAACITYLVILVEFDSKRDGESLTTGATATSPLPP